MWYSPGSLERMVRRTARSLLGARPSTSPIFLQNSSVLLALDYQTIMKMIALKSNSQANGTLPSTPLH